MKAWRRNVKGILDSRRAHYLARIGIFLITAALIAGMTGCAYNPPPSHNLEIRTWYDLDAVRNNLAGNHKLMNDLDASTPGYEELAGPTANAGKGWQPIGLYTPHGPTCCIGFAGAFDGQGYEIRNLFIERPDEDDVGVFKYIEGTVEGIGVTNVTVVGGNSVGGLVGYNFGTLSNCYCTGEVVGNGSVGGLAGAGNGIVIDSYFTGNVAGYEYVGGLVGYNFCNLSKSHFAGNVTGSSYVGGLVGANGETTVSDSYCSGSVTGDEGVGGLVGDSYWEVYGPVEFDVSNSYYDYDEVLVNGEHMITLGALSGDDFDQWLANDKSLDINERLSQQNGYYLINDVNDFRQLLAFGQNATLKFRLTSDLNLAAEPGLYIPYLAGEFDGNGHRISNLSFNSASVCYLGLFGYLRRAGEVTQVSVENVNMTGASSVGGVVGQSWGTVSGSYSNGTVTGSGDIGGLVGGNAGTVSNSYSATSVSGDSRVGGLVGFSNFGTVSDSYSTGSVTADGLYGGGLIGWSRGDVTDSYSTGSVIGEDGVGGLVGANDRGTVSNSYYDYGEVSINGEKVITVGALSGEDFEQWLANDRFLDVNGRLAQEGGYYLINDVSDFKQLLAFGQDNSLKFRLKNNLDLGAEPNLYVPYLAGKFDGNSHKISNLNFKSDFVPYVGLFGYIAPGGKVTQVGVENVNVAGDHYVGGLAGLNAGDVDNSYSTGSVSGGDDVGGLVGHNFGTVSDSHSTATVSGDKDVGGLVGDIDCSENRCGIVSNCYSAGGVSGHEGVGGLVGHSYYAREAVSNSFWDYQTSRRPGSDGGTSKTTARMKNIATFSDAGWNITAVANPGTRNPSYVWNIVNGVTYPFLSWQS